ncbi:MAG: hypothetical protein K1X74_04895 [Pirellulales bacterium]|nr:hypothetical protein [Pirellulales bacterium]
MSTARRSSPTPGATPGATAGESTVPRRGPARPRATRYAPPPDAESAPPKAPESGLRHDTAHASVLKPAAAFVASSSRPTLPSNLFQQSGSTVDTSDALPDEPWTTTALDTARVEDLGWLQDLNRAAAGLVKQTALWEPALEVPAFAWPSAVIELLAMVQRDMSDQLAASDALADTRRAIFVAGGGQGAGATTVALCLARTAIAAGERVVLVDADLSDPSLAIRLGLQASTSWTATLVAELPPGEALVESLGDRAVLAPLAGAVARTEQILGHAALPRFWRELVDRFDRVIVDVGSLSRGAQVAGLIGLQPAELLFVQDTRRPAAPELNQALRCFPNLQACRCGVVQNFVRG